MDLETQQIGQRISVHEMAGVKMKIKDILQLPNIEIGDEILVGKFKNRKATVTGFDIDDNNQPVLKTTKGDQKLFKPRLVKLMKKEK